MHVSARDLTVGDILRYRDGGATVTRVHTHGAQTLVGLDANGTPEVEIVSATASVHIIRTTKEA